MMEYDAIYEHLADAVAEFFEARYTERFSLKDFAALTRIRAEEFEKLAKAGKTEEALQTLKETMVVTMTCAHYFGIPKENP